VGVDADLEAADPGVAERDVTPLDPDPGAAEGVGGAVFGAVQHLAAEVHGDAVGGDVDHAVAVGVGDPGAVDPHGAACRDLDIVTIDHDNRRLGSRGGSANEERGKHWI